MAAAAPFGAVTLLFTDLQDSTPLWERLGEAFRPILGRHEAIIRECLARWSGTEVKTQGDAFMAVFARASDAASCAADVQRAFDQEPWPAETGPLRVRIGVHTGEAIPGVDGSGRPDYLGPVVNRAARLRDAAHGGQTLVSATTHALIQDALGRGLETVNLGRYQLRGLDRPEGIFELRCLDLPPRQFPALRAVGGPRGNLPMRLSAFVGRERELAQLQELLTQSGVRLLTICGPPGCGKTRLSHELGAACAPQFPDGVWVVDPGGVAGAEGVVAQIASTLRVEVPAGGSALDQVCGFLRERCLLLVLDGMERVSASAASCVHRLLTAGPGIRCIVASRSELGMEGEQLCRLAPLAVPETGDDDPARLSGVDSVALFVERARAARGEFELTSGNAAIVAEMCRRLEGIPLAIELAASTVAYASVAEVAGDLAAKLDVLEASSPGAPDRHRTLGRAVEWSYGLLGPEQQQLLQRLSVFSGGWVRDSAQAVCGASALAVRGLCRQSLVSITERQDGSTRFWMLRMIREYARSLLDENPAAAHQLADRHARHYLEYAEARVRQMRSAREPEALEELCQELDNLRSALAWSVESGDGELAGGLALALYEGLSRRGLWEEARERLLGAHAVVGLSVGQGVGQAALSLLLARLSYGLAAIAYDTGETAEALRRAQESRQLRAALGDHIGDAECVNLLGLIACGQGELGTAEGHFREALAAHQPTEHAGLAIALHNLALVASRGGDRDQARRLYEQALVERRAAGDRRGEAETEGNLGVLAHLAGDLAAARGPYCESLRVYQQLRDRRGVGVMLNNLGEIAEAEGDMERAGTLYAQAEKLFGELHSPHRETPAGHLARLEAELGAERVQTWRDAPVRAQQDFQH